MVDRLNPQTTAGTFKYMMYYECANVKAALPGRSTLLHFAVSTFEDPAMIKLVIEVQQPCKTSNRGLHELLCALA